MASVIDSAFNHRRPFMLEGYALKVIVVVINNNEIKPFFAAFSQ